MRGLMMDTPLLLSEMLRFAAECHGEVEVAARDIDDRIHRYTYVEAHERAKRLAQAILRLGIGPGEAAAIALPHPKWQERPLLVVVPRDGATVAREDILNFLAGKVARWWVPDDVVFVEALPYTATGKVHKLKLRERFAGYRLPGEAAER